MNKKTELNNLNNGCSALSRLAGFYKNRTVGILKNSKGLTLVELIIALAISVIVVAAAGFILLTQSGVIRLSRSVSTEQQRLNTAFNTVRYSLRMAGFDYGQSYYIQTGSVPPVQIITNQLTYNGINYYMPYEAEVTYDKPSNAGGTCSISGQKGANLLFSGSGCNIIVNLQPGEFIIVPGTPPSGKSQALCITQTYANNPLELQFNPGVDKNCGQNNPNPPSLPTSGNIAIMSQVLFYWGNGFKSANGVCPGGFTSENFSDGEWCTYNFNDNSTNGNEGNFNKPGNLYECDVQPPVIGPVAPTCAPNTTITLSDYINWFSINPLNYPNNQTTYGIAGNGSGFNLNINGGSLPINSFTSPQATSPVLLLSVIGESDVALSGSPSYSVHVPYNANANGANAKGNAGQIVGNNILKTLNSNIFLRNVFYGK
ncbi:MAG: PilW family protein [bacterium]